MSNGNPKVSTKAASSVQTSNVFIPPPINRLEDTGLSLLWLQDLALKIMYFQGYMTGFMLAEAMALPFTNVVDQILETLKREKFVEVKSSQVGRRLLPICHHRCGDCTRS